jgi:hypothetical protein
MNGKCYITLTAVIFLIAATMHIIRLFNCTQIMIGSWVLPYWMSWFGLIGATALFIWAIFILKNNK